MLDLHDIPFFSGLSNVALARLRGSIDRRRFPTGSVICRKGDEGRAFYAIAAGGVTVELGGTPRAAGSRVFMGPGEVFGEMSIVSGLPVSATVIAAQPSELFVLQRDAFVELLDSDGGFKEALAHMLIDRIRERTGTTRRSSHPGCMILALGDDSDPIRRLAIGLFRGIRHYAPGSFLVMADHERREPPAPSATPDTPTFFPRSGGAVAPHSLQNDIWKISSAPEPDWYRELILNWRQTAGTGQFLVLATDIEKVGQLHSHLQRRDLVAVLEDRRTEAIRAESMPEAGLADQGAVRIVDDTSSHDAHGEDWSFVVSSESLDRARDGSAWRRSDSATFDRVVRWCVGREVGFALGSGAAHGFAHLGVLEVLEDAGVPIDCLAGTSMGGIVSLVYARTGSARDAIGLLKNAIGSSRKVRDVAWIPRASFLIGEKIRAAARIVGGDLEFAQLQRPAFVTAADLAHGTRVVIDRGPVERALLATAAIPGIFPAVVAEGRFLVDGALVGRIPVDVLLRRRCGLTIAVNAIPPPDQGAASGERARQLVDASRRFLGMREVIGRSWELLGWWHGASDATTADILIEPVNDRAGYDFDSFDHVVERGRVAAREKLSVVTAAAENLLRGNRARDREQTE